MQLHQALQTRAILRIGIQPLLEFGASARLVQRLILGVEYLDRGFFVACQFRLLIEHLPRGVARTVGSQPGDLRAGLPQLGFDLSRRFAAIGHFGVVGYLAVEDINYRVHRLATVATQLAPSSQPG